MTTTSKLKIYVTNLLCAIESSPQLGNNESDLVQHFAQKLAEQLIRFQRCCNNCHQAAKQTRTEIPNAQIGFANYLQSMVGLRADILRRKTIAIKEDDLAGGINPESKKKLCSLDSRDQIPHIFLGEDKRVSSDAGVTFGVDSIIEFPSSLAVAKRGFRWSPTRMTVSDLHLRSIPATDFDGDGVRRRVHWPIHQPHHTLQCMVMARKFNTLPFVLWTSDMVLFGLQNFYVSFLFRYM